MDANKYTLNIDQESITPIDAELLGDELEKLRSKYFADVWLVSTDGQAMSMLKSGDNVFMMYLPEPGSPGYSSRSIDLVADRDIEFHLANGQRDYYPESWTVRYDSAINVMKNFWLTQTLLDSVRWYSEDVG